MKTEILVLDIETTGFLPKGLIVEIGIVSLDLENGVIGEIYSSLCKEPGFAEEHRHSWIFDNSELTFTEVMAARDFDEVKEEVQAILDEYPAGVTAYNKKFDFGFLRNRKIVIENELPCPMLVATDICKIPNKYRHSNYKWPSVEEAFNFFCPANCPYDELHRGADDAIHEAMIVHKLYQMGAFNVQGE